MQLTKEDILTGQTDKHIHWLSSGVGIHYDMVAAFQQLQDAAKEDDIHIEIASGYRNFERQFAIWQNKFTGKVAVKDKNNQVIDITKLTEIEIIHAIMLFSALPGASRHHWGTDIDIYAPNLLAEQQKLQLEPWEYQTSGPFHQLSLWLSKNLSKFNFYLPYDKFRGGVAEEPWHISYQPLSNIYQQQHNYALLASVLENSNIAAKETLIATLPELYKRYVSNIAPT